MKKSDDKIIQLDPRTALEDELFVGGPHHGEFFEVERSVVKAHVPFDEAVLSYGRVVLKDGLGNDVTIFVYEGVEEKTEEEPT